MFLWTKLHNNYKTLEFLAFTGNFNSFKQFNDKNEYEIIVMFYRRKSFVFFSKNMANYKKNNDEYKMLIENL